MEALCDLLKIGSLKQPPIRVKGGLLHTMWRLDTTKGSFALKELSSKIDLTNQDIIKNYNLTEHIAWQFKQKGIPAIPAIGFQGHYLTLYNNKGYLLYSWVEGKTLQTDKISEPHALKIAALLAKMHNLHLSVPELTEPTFDVQPNEKITGLIRQAIDSNCPFAQDLQQYQPELLICNEDYQQAIPLLKKQSVVSHGDLDQKNVLWHTNGSPILIDWESARRVNPTYEIVNACLDWSGITTHFDEILFNQMLKGYQEVGGQIDRTLLAAALNGVLGNWINWLVYSIERALNVTEPLQREMGCEQVVVTSATILHLQMILPKLIQSRY